MVRNLNLDNLQFDWNNYRSKLSSYGKEKVMAIMNDYYNSDLTVSDIFEIYSISSGIGSLSREFPRKFVEEKCPYDNHSLEERMPSRNGYSSLNIAICPICGHREGEICNCDGCQEVKNKTLRKKRETIISVYPKTMKKIKYETLSATDKVFLSALLHAGLSDDTSKIKGELVLQNKLSPTTNFDKEILHHLVSRGIISVDPMSPIDAFLDNEFPSSYYIFEVNYLINIEPNTVSLLEYPDREEIINQREECLGIWKQIALNESLEYLVEQMKIAKFDFNPKEKTNLVISHLIEDYSIGQIRNLIYGSVNNAAAWYQKSNITKKHAANSVITTLNNRGERAKVEGWNLKNYHRSFNAVLSQISMVFFDSILKIGNRGYEEVPSIKLIGASTEKD